MPFRRWKKRYPTRRFRTRSGRAEVSNSAFSASVGVITSPWSAPIANVTQILSEGVLAQTNAEDPPADVRGISFLGINFSLNCCVQGADIPVEGVSAMMSIGAAIYVDDVDSATPGIGTFIPNFHYNAITPYGNTHGEYRLPRRTIWREDFLYQVGAAEIPTNGSYAQSVPNQLLPLHIQRRFKRKAFLDDRSGLYLIVWGTNPTVTEVTLAFTWVAAIAWKSRR